MSLRRRRRHSHITYKVQKDRVLQYNVGKKLVFSKSTCLHGKKITEVINAIRKEEKLLWWLDFRFVVNRKTTYKKSWVLLLLLIYCCLVLSRESHLMPISTWLLQYFVAGS